MWVVIVDFFVNILVTIMEMIQTHVMIMIQDIDHGIQSQHLVPRMLLF
jgi:hypothetical protein